MRVRADSPNGEFDDQFGTEVIPSEWRKLTLTSPKKNGTLSHITLLRPMEWIEREKAVVDGHVYITVPECGIDGNARVHSIEPCPEIPDGEGQVITGTFQHQAEGGVELTIEGEPEPIRCTGNHPFWSEDQREFARADSLHPGKSVDTSNGVTHVARIQYLNSAGTVLNIEVHGTHTYRVGLHGTLVHNGNTDFGWQWYESRVLDFFGVPKGAAFRQVRETAWSFTRILDGLDKTTSYEITKFDFNSDFRASDDGWERFDHKMRQLAMDADLLRRGKIDRIRIVTADVLPIEGEGAQYTELIMDLRKEFGKQMVQWFHVCPGTLK